MRVRHPYLASILFLLALSATAWAKLGAMEDQVEANFHAMGAKKLATVSLPTYNVHSATLNGVTIREYVSTATNTVVAVAWNGLKPPDLRSIFGDDVFEEYDAYMKSVPRVRFRAPTAYAGSNFVVRQFVRPRNSTGAAWLTSELSTLGLKSADIK